MKKLLNILLFGVALTTASIAQNERGGTIYYTTSTPTSTAGFPGFNNRVDCIVDSTHNKSYTAYPGQGIRQSSRVPQTSGVKRYAAYITQTSTGYPQATVLYNQLSDTIAWVRTSAGVYTGTLTSAFTSNKVPSITKLISTSGRVFLTGARTGNNTFVITTDTLGGSGKDDGFSQIIEISVYQ